MFGISFFSTSSRSIFFFSTFFLQVCSTLSCYNIRSFGPDTDYVQESIKSVRTRTAAVRIKSRNSLIRSVHPAIQIQTKSRKKKNQSVCQLSGCILKTGKYQSSPYTLRADTDYVQESIKSVRTRTAAVRIKSRNSLIQSVHPALNLTQATLCRSVTNDSHQKSH